MNTKNILTLAITLTLGVILAGSLLMPVIADAQENAGAETELTNTVRGSYTYNIWDGEDVTFEFVKGNPNTFAVNGDTVTITSTQQILIASNFFSMRTGGLPANPGINYQYLGVTAGAEDTLTYAIANGEYTLTIGSTVLTGTLDWMVYAVADGETGTSGLGQLTTPTNAFYTSKADNIVVLGNVYTTGDNDTYFAYYNGELTVNEDYADSSKVNIVRSVANGYTNIYNTTLAVTVGDESFTPYQILAPIKVTGNEADNALISLYGAIPIMVIISLVLLGVGAIYTKRND